jgi:hypothetical protein
MVFGKLLAFIPNERVAKGSEMAVPNTISGFAQVPLCFPLPLCQLLTKGGCLSMLLTE